MRAAVFTGNRIEVKDVPTPNLAAHQLRLAPIAAGICGSDLSAVEHTTEFLEFNTEIGATEFLFDANQGVVFGHEFTAEVLEIGAAVEGYEVGDLLVVLPHASSADGTVHCVGYSNEFPGALSEEVVVDATGHLKIPTGVSPIHAAVTEPLATGVNGVLRSQLNETDGAIVAGCGPVGLGSVVELAARGIKPIVASDPSARRREAALALGATHAVDPTTDDPVETWKNTARQEQRLYVYDAAGRPGLLNSMLYGAPPHTVITIVGMCTTDDTFRPAVAINKNIRIDFVNGPGPQETEYSAFARMLEHINAGRVDFTAVVTGYTGLAGVAEAIRSLRPTRPSEIEHVKVLICPRLDSAEITEDLPVSVDIAQQSIRASRNS